MLKKLLLITLLIASTSFGQDASLTNIFKSLKTTPEIILRQQNNNFEILHFAGGVNANITPYVGFYTKVLTFATIKGKQERYYSMNFIGQLITMISTALIDQQNEKTALIFSSIFYLPTLLSNSSIKLDLIGGHITLFAGNQMDAYLFSKNSRVYYDVNFGFAAGIPIKNGQKIKLGVMAIKPISKAYLTDNNWRFGFQLHFPFGDRVN